MSTGLTIDWQERIFPENMSNMAVHKMVAEDSRMVAKVVFCATSAALFMISASPSMAQPAPGAAPQGPPTAAITLAPATGAAKLKVASGAFKDGGKLPDVFTQNGKNVSPPLTWSAGPKGTQSYVLLVE